MLRLIVKGNDDSTHSIELYENAPVNINYQFTDLHNFGTPLGTFSQTFRIPATNANKSFFGSIQNPNLVSDDNGYVLDTWSTIKRITAEIVYRSIPLARGYIQFKRAYIVNKDLAEYEVVFFGESLDATRSIGDKLMEEIDLSSYDHDPTLANIQSSWNGNLHSGAIRYGLVDRGYKGMNWYAAVYNDDPFDDVPLVSTSFTPFIRVSTLVDAIFTGAGYTVSSAWLDNATTLYMPLMSNTAYLFGDQHNSQGFKVSGTNITEVGGTPNLSEQYDYGSNYTPATHLYTVPYDMRMVFQLQIDINALGSSWSRPIVYKNGNVTVWAGPQVQGGTNYSNTVEVIVDLVQGDTLKFDVVGPAPDYLINVVVWQSLSIYRINDGYANWLQANLPKVKQVDFIRSLQQAFNLIIVPDSNAPKLIYIEPWSDYIGTGLTKDWTDKIDFSKDVIVEPTVSLQKRRYEWRFNSAKDIINAAVEDQNDRTWGRHEVIDTANDFASGEYEVKPQLVGYITAYIPFSDVIVHRAINSEGKPIQDPLPRLAYWNGTYSPTNSVPVHNGSSATNISSYGLFTPYSAFPATLSDSALMFGGDTPFTESVVQPQNTLWYSHYRNMFTELYSVDARMVTLYLRLTASDINQFRWSDKIFIRDTYYRIQSISGYTANDEATTKCELVKILEPGRDCDYTVESINSTTNIVLFQDVDGVSTYGNRRCCEYYGYQWINDRCYNQGVSTDHEGGAGGSGTDIDSVLNTQAGLQTQIDDITATTDLITVTSAIDLDNLETPDTSPNDLFQIFLEK